jgi:hypothetical protein
MNTFVVLNAVYEWYGTKYNQGIHGVSMRRTDGGPTTTTLSYQSYLVIVPLNSGAFDKQMHRCK